MSEIGITVTLEDARELLHILQQCDTLLDKALANKDSVVQAQTSTWEVYLMMRRLLASFRRLGLPEEIDAAISEIQRMIMIIHSLELTISALEATTPLGWIKFGMYFFSSITQMATMGQGYRR